MADIPESTKLLPCPFCGSGSAPYVHPTRVENWFGVTCDDERAGCGACIIADGRDQAVALWNTRAAPPAMDREAVELDCGKCGESIPMHCDCSLPGGLIAPLTERQANDQHLIGLLRREAAHSGVWFASQLAEAADRLSTLSADAIRQGEGATEQEALQRAIDRMGWAEINAFHAELRRGQDIYEDAGGFFMRAIRALFGIKPTDPVTNYQDAARALVEAATPAVDAALEREVDCSICGGDCAGANPPVMNCPALATPASHASDGGKA